MPRDLFAEHPEYFRMNAEGKRTSDYNFCVSSSDALSLVARRAAELAEALYGSSNRFYFWMDDGHDLRCHCPLCARLSASDQQLIALNAMLREIRKHRPNARMAYLAYMDTVVTPTAVTAVDGIFLEYAPFEKYTAKGEDAQKLIKQEREMMLPLMRFFNAEPKKLLEYWYDNSLFSHWTRPPQKFVLNEAAMRAEASEYIADGFDIISTFACFLGDDYEQLYGDFDIAPFADCVIREDS